MNKKEIDSIDAIKKFLNTHRLNYSSTRATFTAKVDIETEHNTLSEEFEILISLQEFNCAGKLTILDIENIIDPYTFPDTFKVEYDKFDFTNNLVLKISGNHSKNPKIGKYSVSINLIESL